MARYLFDTSILISFSKGREPWRSRLLNMATTSDELGVCAIVVAEIYSGVAPHERPAWESFFSAVTHWPITPEAAERAGTYRYAFARVGRAIATPDALIAAVAVDIGAILLTANVKDFPMADVVVESL